MSDKAIETFEKLSAPFKDEDLDWRIMRGGYKNNKPWALLATYVTSRAIQDRLDFVMGPSNWQDKYRHEGEGFICDLSLRIDGEWISKSDGAQITDVEGYKGGISGALKRAGVKWGMGRYLYHLGETWATFCDKNEEGALSGVVKDAQKKKYYVNFEKPLLNGRTSFQDPKTAPTYYSPNKEQASQRIIDHIKNGDLPKDYVNDFKLEYGLENTENLGELKKALKLRKADELKKMTDFIAVAINDLKEKP